ncbi:MAG: hypothetical protein ACLUD2_02540 [Clostridium sp.]
MRPIRSPLIPEPRVAATAVAVAAEALPARVTTVDLPPAAREQQP